MKGFEFKCVEVYKIQASLPTSDQKKSRLLFSTTLASFCLFLVEMFSLMDLMELHNLENSIRRFMVLQRVVIDTHMASEERRAVNKE